MNELNKLTRLNNLAFSLILVFLFTVLFIVLWDLYFNNIVCEFGTLNNRCMFEDEYYHMLKL